MDEPVLYKKIAETIRKEILTGELKPGDRLPSVRQMAEQWGCTVGTVQHAYQDLARQGLVTLRAGQGSRVVEELNLQGEIPLRRAALIHRAEEFLLESLTSGHSLEEVERALHHAMDRWRSVEQEQRWVDPGSLRFSGSHDLALAWLAGHLPEAAGGANLELRFTGSLGGLIALAEGKADLAGSHLWDAETDTYNEPFVRRLLPGQRVALVTLAHRRNGLIVAAGNPFGIQGLKDLCLPGVRFVNRQAGSGTRVWLDAALRIAGMDGHQIQGYEAEKITHSAVAQAVAEDLADAGLGLEAAALSYSLDFVPLTRERYDLVIPQAVMELAAVRRFIQWLAESRTKEMIQNLGGYEVEETAAIRWIE
jgi:molybdate-binding protein/DNA-binding transcriptional regulator YhcF (GntR family)